MPLSKRILQRRRVQLSVEVGGRSEVVTRALSEGRFAHLLVGIVHRGMRWTTGWSAGAGMGFVWGSGGWMLDLAREGMAEFG